MYSGEGGGYKPCRGHVSLSIIATLILTIIMHGQCVLNTCSYLVEFCFLLNVVGHNQSCCYNYESLLRSKANCCIELEGVGLVTKVYSYDIVHGHRNDL